MTLMNNSKWPAKLKTLLFVSLLILSGCTIRTADLTLVSTKNIDLSNSTFDLKQGRRTKGEDCSIALLGFIPLGFPNLEEAVDNALEKGNGNVMVDQVTYRTQIYFILATRMCLEVEGTVLNVNETS